MPPLARLLLLCCALALPGAAQAAEPPGARAFVDSLYGKLGDDASADPSRAKYKALFDSPLVEAMQANWDYEDKAQEIGVLDFDPFCQCQDNEGMTHRISAVSGDDRAATVTVIDRWPPPAEPAEIAVTFSLARGGPHGWRIRDIGTADTPSLASEMQRGLADLASTPPGNDPPPEDR